MSERTTGEVRASELGSLRAAGKARGAAAAAAALLKSAKSGDVVALLPAGVAAAAVRPSVGIIPYPGNPMNTHNP